MTQHSKTERFVEYLLGLEERKDTGALAALRRGLGRMPGTAPEMHRYVVPWSNGESSRWREDVFYIVAALFAYHPIHWSRDKEARSNLGDSFARLRHAEGVSQEGIERRFTGLLSVHMEDLHVHLRHAVSLLKSKTIPIDWVRLLDDLKYWGHEDRLIQRNWARAFWRVESLDVDGQDNI
ncbi:MAG: type I-E CRISPR-associated protein Cse2/CasB [Caldilineaceae bacterium]|nr:type I-E CRISPR-associated protein Cse2/CasB [Caldilineaceae bacterium]